MSPELFELLSDALKMLGPASIAALATYKMGRTQLDMKIKEIESANEFNARVRLFEYDLRLLEHEEESQSKTGKWLGQLIGMAGSGEPDPTESKFIEKSMTLVSHALPEDLMALKRQMVEMDMGDSELLSDLEAIVKKVDWHTIPSDSDGVQTRVYELFEAGAYVTRCRQAITRAHMNELLEPYLKAK